MARLSLLLAAFLATYVVASPDYGSDGGDDSNNDCPPYNTTTRTKTTGAIEYESTPPVITWTYTSYPSRATVNLTKSTQSTIGVAPTVTTAFTTITTTTITSIPAESTVTVPTVSGFTPVSCEAAYLDPTVTVTTTTTTTIPQSTTIYKTGSTQPTYTSTVTEYTTTITISSNNTVTRYTYPTVTSTSTRADPTQTVYDACATNNVVSDYPNGGFVNVPFHDDGSGTDVVYTSSIDATDCCSICQGNSSCTGSFFVIQRYSQPQCGLVLLSFPNATTCDPKFSGAYSGLYGWFGFPLAPAQAYISNSGCGQIDVR